ncbi:MULTISPECIES: hypothetical protein [Persicobacter]|uniref:Peptidase C-terminal archaeal/bacterial domain-containing protein n=1 Tax=Persicobacter diffluens TaxID=981 RepID=A0AAN4VWQ0_9BACT|nr:hypothetical protein [Persicobacter sp. CCB-QB2]GJM60318.1 hypothetical protein PEDI_08700 [Persicobacter diffluens]
MKNLLFVFLFLAFGLVAVSPAQAQCNSDGFTDTCLGSLKDGFTFLKSFKIDGQGGAKQKVEYSYVFSKDTKYYINVCGQNGVDGIIVTMYDSNRKLVATNHANGKFYPGITYPCNATGIYYITFTFKDSENYCGGSVLGFSR